MGGLALGLKKVPLRRFRRLRHTNGKSVVARIFVWSIPTNPTTITAATASTAGTETFQAVDCGQDGSVSGNKWPYPLDVKFHPILDRMSETSMTTVYDSAADNSLLIVRARYRNRVGGRHHYQKRLTPYRSNRVSIETRGTSKVRACAINIRSKGSRCDPGSRPARSPLRTVIGNT